MEARVLARASLFLTKELIHLRYVSRSPKYSVGVGEPTMVNVHGIITEHTPKKIAKFTQGLALDHELEAALKHFTFRGLPDGVPPETMISVLDTRDYQAEHKLTDEERESMEEWIESRPAFGQDYIKVDEIRAPKPWPSYDDDSEEKIVEAIENFGFDPDEVRRYEQENLNRADLLEKLVELGAGDVQRTDLDELRSFSREEIEVTDRRTGNTKTVVVQA